MNAKLFGALQFAIWICLFTTAFSADDLHGTEPGIRLSSVQEDVTLWGNSGETLTVTLEVSAAPGWAGQLDGEAFQIAGELAAPLPEGKLDQQTLSLDGRSHQTVVVSLPLPKVERETMLLVRFQLRSLAGKSEAVYPVRVGVLPGSESPLNPVRRLRELSDGILVIRGESPNLRAFFESRQIPFVDGVDGRPGAVVLEESTEPVEPSAQGASVLWFAPPDSLLPGVYPGPDRLIKVTLPVPAQLATNPRAAQTLAEMIFRTLTSTNPTPTTTP